MTTTPTIVTTTILKESMTEPADLAADDGRLSPYPRPLFSSVRTRLLASFVLLLTLAAVASTLVARQILLHRLDQRIDDELVQESRELRVLAQGNDPETGRPFGDRIGRIFEEFLQRNIPSRNEAMLTFVDGQPFLRSRAVVPYQLDRDSVLVARWAALQETERGWVATPAGRVEFLAVPVKTLGNTAGVFVVAIFRDRERELTDAVFAGVAATSGAVLIIGSLLAWIVAERILRPVKKISQTARSITDTDLSQRIEVEGRDEVADLAATFNEMLDRLEEAFRTQKQFIDDAGHELRTPITIVRGHLETIDAAPDDRPKVMTLVMDELDRMSRLVEDLLLLARSRGPDFLDVTMVDVKTLTEEVRAKAEAIAPRQWTIEEVGSGRIEADRQRVTQALLQLAHNATKHTREGDVIALGSRVTNGEARFWVRDRGRGVDPADRERIFERFERGRDGRKRAGGAGLGLAIVRAIASAHHGRIELDSQPGQGATFHVVMPIDQPAASEGERAV
jgi:two-component system OmpR family sensor kinase